MTHRVVAIDGPSYVGKSSVAKALAALTGFTFINTGHMYRAVAERCLSEGVALENEGGVLSLCRRTIVEFIRSGADCLTFVDGRDRTLSLDAPEVVLAASRIARIPALRDLLTARQRAYAERQDLIMEGRDIGTLVFPDARWKFFLTASAEVRARRMWKMLDDAARRSIADSRTLIPKILELDENDMNRAVAPLRQADDAIVYDNSDSPTALQDAQVLSAYIAKRSVRV
jgi:cytidylate kinase